MKSTSILIVATITLALVLAPGWSAAEAADPPRLVLQITVDALRGDLPGRYAHLFGDGGFRYLMDEGVHYTNAHYQHANTETIVGHVSLATGTVPAAHGMVCNVWFDREKGRLAYNIEDPDHYLLTAGADIDRTTEIDPTQKAATVDGRSPATILTSTFSDDLTLDFAKALIDSEQLGRDEVPDYLSVSFSSTDYVGHVFGASSLESEDNLARLDRTLAALFSYVDDTVGLENTLIVLSADHGQPEIPGYLRELGIEDARHFDTNALDKAPAIAALKAQFGIDEELIEAYYQPYVYLNRDLIREKGLDQAEVEEAVADELVKFDGVALAVSSIALRTASLPDTLLMRAILRNFHPKRSGDIYVVFEPYVFINDFDGLIVASTHGSPWRYDTFVPVMFAGAGLAPERVARPVTPYDVAPTLANFLGVKPPSGAIGNPLVEVVGN